MNITTLYEALDELVADAEALRETFNEDGELLVLANALDRIGETGYRLERGVRAIAASLKFEE